MGKNRSLGIAARKTQPAASVRFGRFVRRPTSLLRLCSTGMRTNRVNEWLWFHNVGLSGKDGMMNRKWPAKTLETVLKENKHVDVSRVQYTY